MEFLGSDVLVHVLLLILGLGLVSKGGDLFVESSVEMAHILRVPHIVIGATIVSLATTVPELTVSVMASMVGNSGIALGNAVGSAIANIGLVIGLVACMTKIDVDLEDFQRRAWWMVGSAILVIFFTWRLRLGPVFGMILLLVSIAYLFVDYWIARQRKTEITKEDSQEPKKVGSLKKSVFLFLIGLALVIFGSRILVQSGIALATAMGVPSVIIGLSIIAVGTSLPELVTGIAAARKGVPDLSVGNIVGANVLNLALIVGLSSWIHPLTLTRFTQLYSFPWLVIFIFAMIWVFRSQGKVRRREGLILLSLYLAYILGLMVLPMVLDI